MGRLPSTFSGRIITARVPYEIAGELALTDGQQGQQFPEATFMCRVDKPFEVHRLIPRLYALDDGARLLSPQPDQDLLAGLMRMRVHDVELNQDITKTPTLISLLTKGASERTWEWAEPHYLVKGQFQVTLDALTFPTNAAIANLNSIRCAISFQGFLLVTAPATQER